MRISTWLFAVALVGLSVGCGGGSSGGSSSGSTTAASKAVAEALTTSVSIPNALLKMGAIPAPDADKVMLTQNDPPISMQPGGGTLMNLAADNPDEGSDPVDSLLIQFSDSDSHFEVPRSAGSSGKADGGSGKADAGTSAQGIAHLMNMLMLDSHACDNLCNQKFQHKMLQAVMLHSGKVSKSLSRDFELDCTKDGDATKCGSSSGSTSKADAGKATSTGKDAGASSGGSTSTASYGNLISEQMLAVDAAACTCGNAPDKSTQAFFCATAPYPKAVVDCVKSAADAAGSSASVAANCHISAIMMVANTCPSGCTCTSAAVDAAIKAANCPMIPGASACFPNQDGGTAAPADAGAGH